jgi:hypothetical protein
MDEEKKPKRPAEAAASMPEGEDEEEYSDVFELTAEDLEGAVDHSPDYQPPNPTAILPSAWVSSPAQVGLSAEAIDLLRQASTLAKLHQQQIEWVRLRALPNRKLLLVAPTHGEHPEKVRARRSNRGPLRFNAVSVLRPASMHVETGFRERYRVKLVKESPIGPAIVVLMGKTEVSRAKQKRKRGKGKSEEPKAEA